MWYLQADTLVWLLLSTLLYGALSALLGRFWPGRRLTPLLLLWDLALLLFVSRSLAAFYIGYTLATYGLVRLLGLVREGALKRGLFVGFSVLCAAPFLYARLALQLPALPAVMALVGLAYNMLKAIDALFYVYYAGKEIPLLTYANFLLFYPVLTAGPIMRYRDFEKFYLAPRAVDAKTAEAGVKRFIRGLFKKMVLVAALGMVLERLLEMRLCLPVSLGLIFVSWFYLYFDLSGYSDLAIATASFTGFTVAENFKNPLSAASFTQFWRKWHVTLSDWIREHIFVVVNGRRLNKFASAAIGMCTMIIMSLWHEFSWATVVSGVYMGAFLVIENIFGLSTVDKRRTSKLVYYGRCFLVNFFFGINALSFSLDLPQVLEVVKGLLRL